MKKIMKTLSLLLAVGAMAFGSGLHHEDTKANAAETTATLSFANKAQRTSISTTKQVWKQNGITFTNDKASSTNAIADYANPVRLYQGSSITVEYSAGNITKIVFDANTAEYATTLKKSIGSSATASGDKVTVENNNNTFTVAKLTAQIRLDSITVTYNKSTGGEGTVDPEPETPVIPDTPTTGEEVLLYSTGFESSEGHSKSTSYDSTKTTGATGKQWTTYYGTPTTTDKISGDQSLQMRVYKEQPSAPNSKMDFDVENATKITFVAKNTNGINLKLYYSIDKGSNWTLGKSFTISSTANEYSYNVSASSGTIRFKFECDYTTVSSKSRLTIDDVCIYGVKEETTATLTSISVDSTQTKTAFIVGETLKAEEIYLNGLYSDGKTRRIETGFTTNPALGTIFTETDISEAKNITVNYEGVASTSFEVSIIADYLTSLSRTNLENTFYEGDLLSIGSGKLIASYASGKEVELTLESEGVEVTLNDQVIEIPYTLSLEDNGASIDINFTDGGKTQSISAYKINVFEKLPTTGISFELVTDASTLKANDRIIIANAEAGQALSINQAKNNRSGAEIAVANSAITSPSADVEIITLENGTKDGTLSFKVNGGYLYAVSSNDNHLRTEAEKTDNSSWTISIDESGVATIIAQGENTRNNFRFNENGGNPIFSCYASTATMKKVEIYKYSFTNELNNLISRVTDAKTCDDYESASTFRSDYNLLSEYEQSIFNSTVVDSQSEYEGDASTVTLENKLAYMEYLAGLEKQSEGLSSNLLSNITSSNNILIILVVGLLGLTSILGYYFLNKKKYAK